jgi:hypothetical protein
VPVLEVAVVAFLVVREYLVYRERVAAGAERDRLVRLCFADAPAERLVALAPVERPVRKDRTEDERPAKPIGL